jgi:NAD(P)-dependent dehydrogenase (short-subunit alcohol dehydrogenase family)
MSSNLQAQSSSEASFRAFLRRQCTAPTPLPDNVRVEGQIAIITGSNVGIGLEASRQLLELGLSRLIMGVRSQAKGDKAATQLRKEFPGSEISVWIIDMESYDSIREFSGQCASLPRIDIVILNAGLMVSTFTVSAGTGHEIMMQVNYLSTVLLAMLLVPILKAKKATASSRPPTLDIVGSDLAYRASLKTEDTILTHFDDPKRFGQLSTYSNSKLLLVFFVAKLAALVKPSDVLINMSNPGMTKGTSLGRDAPAIAKKIFNVVQYPLARPISVGASVYLYAVLGLGAESHGSFVSDWAIKP